MWLAKTDYNCSLHSKLGAMEQLINTAWWRCGLYRPSGYVTTAIMLPCQLQTKFKMIKLQCKTGPGARFDLAQLSGCRRKDQQQHNKPAEWHRWKILQQTSRSTAQELQLHRSRTKATELFTGWTYSRSASTKWHIFSLISRKNSSCCCLWRRWHALKQLGTVEIIRSPRENDGNYCEYQ